MSNFKQISKKLLSLTLALVMCLGFLPATARAADESDTQISTDNYVKLKKTAQYDPDKKSYSIDLEAFVLGEVETTTTPLDIVLVVDQSGSMYRDDSGVHYNNPAERKVTKLKAALTQFVENIYQNAAATSTDHRIALVGFGGGGKEYRTGNDRSPKPNIAGIDADGKPIYSSDTFYQCTGLFVDGYFKNFQTEDPAGTIHDLTDDDYKASIVPVNNGSGGVTESITRAIDNIVARSYTCPLYGLQMAEKIFAAEREAESARTNTQKVVIIFSDGQLASGPSDKEGANANKISSKATDLKNSGVKVYSVAFGAYLDFLKNIASEPKDKYYFSAKDRDSLLQAFQNISVDALNLPVKATRTTVLSDTLSPQFRFPEGFDPAKQLTLKAVPVAETGSETYSWNTDGAVALTSSDGTTFTGKLGEEKVTCTVTVNIQDKTVEVTGFDYSSNAHCVRKQDGKWQGWKLVMGFPIEPDTNCKAWNGNGSFPTNNGAQLSGCETQNGDEVIKKTVTIPNPSAPVDTHTIKYGWGNGLKTENVTTKLPTPSQTAYIDGQSEAVSGAVKPGGIIETTDGALYRFDYWTVNGEKFEGPIEINGENVTLTAKLTQVYSVTYTGKDAASGEPPVDEKSPYKEGDTVAVRPDSGSLVRTGYTFTGWKAQEDAATPADGKFTMPARHIVFDPQWTINEHTLKVEYSYVGDEGTGPELPESYTQTLDFGTEYTVGVPSFDGYTVAVTGDPVTGTVPDKDLQVFVTYTRNDTTVERSYTVKYFFDGVEDTARSKTYTVHVWAGDASGKVPLQADVDTSLQPGYGTPAVTTGDNVPYAGELTRGTLFDDGEVITVSYVRDDEKVKETYYTVEHIVDEQVRDKATVHSSDWLLAETPMATVTEASITPREYFGYKHTETKIKDGGAVPEDRKVPSGTVIQLIYVRDESVKPELTVSKTVRVNGGEAASAVEAKAGDTIIYTITVTNRSPGPAGNVQLTDIFSGDSGSLTWLTDDPEAAFSVPAESSRSFIAAYTVSAEDAGKTITNSAVLKGDPAPGGPDTSVTVDEIPEPAPEKISVVWVDGHTGDILKRLPNAYEKGTEEVPEEAYPAPAAHPYYAFEEWEARSDEDGNIIITATYRKLDVTEGPSFEELEKLDITVEVTCDSNAVHEPLNYSSPLKEGSFEAEYVEGTSWRLTIYPDLYAEECGHSEVGVQEKFVDLVFVPAPIEEGEDETMDGSDQDVSTPPDDPAQNTDTDSENVPDGEDASENEDVSENGNASDDGDEPDNEEAPEAQILSLSQNERQPAGEWKLASGEEEVVTFTVHCEKEAAGPDPEVPETRKVTILWMDGYSDGVVDTDSVDISRDAEILSALQGAKTPERPTREGYTFSGWASEPDVREEVSTIIIKAEWKADSEDAESCIVTFWVNGRLYSSKEYKYGEALAVPEDPDPYRDGSYRYYFRGWTPDLEHTVVRDRAYNAEFRRVYIGGGTDDDRPSGGGTGGTTPTPTPTPIPDNPTPLDPGITIDDQEVPLAGAVGLNDTDHFAYVIGRDEDHVYPLANITRAEAATIFFRLMTEDFRVANWSTTNSFTDVKEGDWYNNAISTCARAGILKGREDGRFDPNASITRAEFAAIAARFLDESYTDDGTGDFADTASHWAAREIRLAAKAGWITGSGNVFNPNDFITRAQVMTIVNRMLDRTPDKDHMLPEMKKWVDCPENAWYYEAVQEATNEHDYTRDETSVETWTALKEGTDWAALELGWAANNGASAPAAEVETQGLPDGI